MKAAACTERALLFACGAETLHGVLTTPPQGNGVGVVIVVGGPQYRVGSHRQFVQLARHLASAGCAVLRFDARGMGDSTGTFPGFERLTPDIAAANDALAAQVPGLRRIVLWGLCDGASAALLYLDDTADPRISGLCLVNPWVRSAATQAQATLKHYYRDRLRQPAFWRKVLSGQVAWSALAGLVSNWRKARARPAGPEASGYQDRMARACAGFHGPTLVLLSESDYTAREFETLAGSHAAWRAALQRPDVQTVSIGGADHTFSAAAGRRDAERRVADWITEAFDATAMQATPPTGNDSRARRHAGP